MIIFEKKFKFTKFLVTFCFVFSYFISPFFASRIYAQSNEQQSQTGLFGGNSVQATGAASNEQDTGATQFVDYAGQAIGTCSIGSLLSGYISNYLHKFISTFTGSINSGINKYFSGLTETAIEKIIDVEVEPVVPVKESLATSNLADLVDKESGGGKRWGLLTGITSNLIKTPSFDAIGFCIVNEIIRYIGDETVKWINSGFEGSPEFIENPEGFFENIANVEGGAFVAGIIEGATGQNICEGIRPLVSLNLISSYYNNHIDQTNRARCSLDRIKDTYDRFLNGNWNSGGFQGWFELIRPQNNYYGANIYLNTALNRQIAKRQIAQNRQLNWGNGYKTFTVCGNKREDGSYDPKDCQTTTPSQYVQTQIQARNYAQLNRLTIADEFDEIVTALVNQLIKMAINKMLESSN